MNRPDPLFLTGPARSGSTLLCHMLAAHPDIEVAADAFFPLLKSFRNAAVRRGPEPGVIEPFDPDSPLADYYFSDDGLAVMDTIQGADLDVLFPASERESLIADCSERAEHESPDLVAHLGHVEGQTYEEVLRHAFGVVADVRGARRWSGVKEVWSAEFIRPLARSLPDLRAALLLRDPRAVVASMIAIPDVSQVAHTLSYLRHWRKCVAIALHHREDPDLVGRVHVLTYEALVEEPEKTLRELCTFLDVAYDPGMLDPSRYVDRRTGRSWAGNSSFDGTLSGVSPGGTTRWKDALDPRIARVVELVCGPDMALLGYEPVCGGATEGVLEYVVQDGRRDDVSWRSDFHDPQLDYGFELFRRALLKADEGMLDTDLVRRSFLFEDVFMRIKEGGTIPW